jgi:hypothetical protein
MTRNTVFCAAAVLAVVTTLTACEDSRPKMRADTFPMSEIDRFDQPVNKKPLFGSNDYWRERDVWPVALADIREPLPPAVPLPERAASIDVLQPEQASTSQSSSEQGGAHPASGMAQGITNAQGDGESNKLDGGTSK